MSRVRVSPTEWRLEEPGSAFVRAKAFSVQAATIGSMNPALTFGGTYIPAQTDDGWLRRESNAAAARRYRERRARA